MSYRLNPNNTWKLVEERYLAEENPRRKRNLELVLEHMKREAEGDIEGVVATLTESPKYKIWPDIDDPISSPGGSKDAIRGFYDRSIVQTGAHQLELTVDRVIVDDHAVLTEGLMRMAYPGKTLAAIGIDVPDEEGYYLTESRMAVIWPVDHDEDRLTGEEVYTAGDTFAGIADRPISQDEIAPLQT